MFVRIPILGRPLATTPRAAAPIVAALLATVLATGCSGGSSAGASSRSDAAGSHTLAGSAQIATFVEDVARGDREHWTLDAGASPAARRAWANEEATKSIGIELRFGQAYFACMELSMLRHGSSTHEAVLIAKRRGGAVIIANRIATEYTRFTSAELGYIIDADCGGQPL